MGKKIELNDLLSKNRLNKLYEIVITDKEWKQVIEKGERK